MFKKYFIPIPGLRFALSLFTFNFFLFTFLSSSFADISVLQRSNEDEEKISVKVIKKLPIPRGYHEGLYFDGKNIWVNNGRGLSTWVIDINDGSVLSVIKPPGPFTEAIIPAGDNRYLVTDWDDKKLYNVIIEDDVMKIEEKVSLAPDRPTGLIKAKGKLYIVTWKRGMGTKYFLIELGEDLKIIKTLQIKNIFEPAHLAWDGSYLWITSWYSKRVYKVDLVSNEILGYFESPAAKTTGIAWDGKYFWITGTYADLYQVEVLEGSEPQT